MSQFEIYPHELLTNPTFPNSKLSFSLWIDKVVRHTCTVVFCKLNALDIYGELKEIREKANIEVKC